MTNKPTFSPSQNEAIISRGENLLVAAGAGSGKNYRIGGEDASPDYKTVLVSSVFWH